MKPNTLLHRTCRAVRVHPCAWGETRSAERPGSSSAVSRPAVPPLSSTCPRHVHAAAFMLAGELRWQCADYVVGAWTGGRRSTRGIASHNRCSSTFLVCKRSQVNCALPMGVQDLDAFHLPNLGTKLVHITRWDSSTVPHPRLSLVQTDARHSEQTPRQRVINQLNPFRAAEHLHVIQESTHLLSMLEGGCNLLQST